MAQPARRGGRAGTGHGRGSGTGGGSGAVVTLTDAATIVVDASAGRVFEVTLGGGRTLANATGVAHGETYAFIIRQDATGGRALTLASGYVLSTGAPLRLSTAPSTVNVLQFVAVGTTLHLLGSHFGPCAAGSQRFNYTGSDQLLTVPAGCSEITVKAWGAGGGGGGASSPPTTAVGGGGGYSTTRLAVTPLESLTVIVGAGGHGSTVAPVVVYGGGGCGNQCSS